MTNIFRVRKIKMSYKLLLLVVLALAIWLNLELFKIDNVTCLTAGAGSCTELLSHAIFEYVAYTSIIVFALLLMYYYVFNTNEQAEEIEENEEFKTDYRSIVAKYQKHRNIDDEVVEDDKEPTSSIDDICKQWFSEGNKS